MGDVPTGDGIERVPRLESLSAPRGGEGGSVPQALGSKAEERAKRRKKKKDSYAKYLESSTWKSIRRCVLARDKHTCRACGSKAQVVHHIRYPKNLGEERLEWLYALCSSCHDEIHRVAKTTTLRKATHQVLGMPPSPRKQRRRKAKKAKPPPKSNKELRREARAAAFRKQGKSKLRMRHTMKRTSLTNENENLHEFFKANRERRERFGHERA